MREVVYSIGFQKAIEKLNNSELKILVKKVEEIRNAKDINHYKNLRGDLKKFKRAHINNCYVILFFGTDNSVYFIDYSHHDNIYKVNKKKLKKYESILSNLNKLK